MQGSTLKADLLLVLTALIWGSAFVAQRIVMDTMGPFLYTGARFALGALVVLPLALRGQGRWDASLWKVGVLAGTVLFFGAAIQQIGLIYTTAGKAGFITGLYVVMVPILGLLVGQKTTLSIGVGIVLSVIGLYFISFTQSVAVNLGDIIVFGSAIFWAGHVVLVSLYAGALHAIRLAFIQFMVCSLLSFVAAGWFETVSLSMLSDGLYPILYGGLVSVGIGYTLQVVAQRHALASHAAIILSLEAVFAALAGGLFLNEVLSAQELFGCALMLLGMIVAQLGPIWRQRRVQRGLPQGDHPA